MAAVHSPMALTPKKGAIHPPPMMPVENVEARFRAFLSGYRDDGGVSNVLRLDAIIKRLYGIAVDQGADMGHSIKASEVILNRAYGKPKQQVEVAGEVTHVPGNRSAVVERFLKRRGEGLKDVTPFQEDSLDSFGHPRPQPIIPDQYTLNNNSSHPPHTAQKNSQDMYTQQDDDAENSIEIAQSGYRTVGETSE